MQCQRSRREARRACPAGHQHFGLLALGFAALWSTELFGGNFRIGPLDGEWQLRGSYSYAVRTEEPHPGVIASDGREVVETPEYLKWPESNNYDDGDRNFAQWDAVNNRASLLGEVHFRWGPDFGALFRGDAFYDLVYRQDRNANTSPDSISTSQDPFNSFTDEARFFSGKRARLLDAYAYGTWYLDGDKVLNLRAGKHIAAWGESLFFSGVALAQAPADATKATVPGADVKSILLPVNQLSMQLSVNSKLTLLGQYKLEFKPIELNPVGEFFSPADVVGPGAETIYGIRNPLFLDNLSRIDLTSNDLIETLNLVGSLLLGVDLGLPLLIPDGLPPVQLPETGIALLNAPRGVDVARGPDIRPSDHGQWGFGLRYAFDYRTTLGLYHLRYHAATPAPVQNYGFGVLAPSPLPGVVPDLTTELLGLQVPVTYNVRYFDGIHLTAASASTVLFGANVGGEFIYRQGADVLVDVYAPILGLVPTPTRADIAQAMVSWLYVIGPKPFWDSLAIVGEAGFVHVENVTAQESPVGGFYDQLTFDRDASAVQMQLLFDYLNVFPGWDMTVPIGGAGVISGHSALSGGLGSLMGEDDYRLSVGVEFTRLSRFTVGLGYNAYFGGSPHFQERPYQDRDNLAFTLSYDF